MSTYGQKIKNFYASHPYHIKVDTEELLKKYSGLEEELWLSILAKYPDYHNFEQELKNLALEAGVTLNPSAVTSFLGNNKSREAAALRYFYNKRCLSQPAFVKRKLREVYKNQGSDFNPDNLVSLSKGAERKLLMAVSAKYLTGNPTPVKRNEIAKNPIKPVTVDRDEIKPLREVYGEQKKAELPKPPVVEPIKPSAEPKPVAQVETARPEALATPLEEIKQNKTVEKKAGIPRGVIIAGQALLIFVAVVAIAFGVYVATDMRIDVVDKLLGNSSKIEEKVEELKVIKSEGSTITADEFFEDDELEEIASEKVDE